jgi:kinesin family protein C1
LALADELTALRGQVASTQADLSEARRSKASLEQHTSMQLTTLMSELEDSKRQLTAVRAEVGEALAVAGVELGATDWLADCVRDLRAQMFQSKSCARTLQEELAKERAERQTESQSSKAVVELKSQEVDRLIQERRSLEVECNSWKEHRGSSISEQTNVIAKLQASVDKLVQQNDKCQNDVVVQHSRSAEDAGQINALVCRVAEGDAQRRALHNAIQNLKGNIRVMCRLRPALGGEEQSVVQQPEPERVKVSHGAEAYAFNFDKVFGTDSTQADVFSEMDSLVQSALDGYKVCLFAYGQTGSGKTFTMQGTPGSSQTWGLIPRSLAKIFQEASDMKERGWTWTLEASFLEVYNETLRDLLRDSNAAGSSAPLSIQHSDVWGSTVVNAIAVKVDSMEQVDYLMKKASKQRAVGCTDMNATSSRSHSMFALYLCGINEGTNEKLHGALHLVDLAGSERLDKSGAEGDRLRETQSINKSLSCLTDVFVAKAERHKHVPFRNSKLTHLMEPCLSGEGKTLMIVNVAPESSNAHESLCSLRFAGRVGQCNTGGKPKRGATALNAAASASGSAEAPRPKSAMAPSRARAGAK